MTASGAMRRVAALERLRMYRGVWYLRAVAITAPWLGMLGCLELLIQYVRRTYYDPNGVGCYAGGIAEIFVTAPFGLAVATIAMSLHHWLSGWAGLLVCELQEPKERRVLPTASLPMERARRAALRAAAREELRLRRRFRYLNGIVAVAPLLGLLGTIIGIVSSFVSMGGPMRQYLGVVFGHLSAAFVPVAFGLGIGVFAYCLRAHMAACADSLALEMESAATMFSLRSEES